LPRSIQHQRRDYVDAVDRGWEAMYASTASASGSNLTFGALVSQRR
jgi:hypothetical protein